MRRITALVIAAVLVLVVTFTGVARADENDFKVTLSASVLSAYVLGDGVRLHGPVYQHGMDILSPWGVYLAPWQSVGLNDSNLDSDDGDEIDWTAGWRKKIGNTDVDVGGTYLLIPPFRGPAKKHIVRVFGEVSHTFSVGVHTIAPSLRLEYSMRPPGSTARTQASVLVLNGVSHFVPLTNTVAMFDKVSLNYDSGALTGHHMFLFQSLHGLRWNPTKRVTIEAPNIKLSIPITHTPDNRKFEAVFGAGIVVSLF